MNQPALPLQTLCDDAIRAALEAGQFVQSADRNTLQRYFKDAGSGAASQLVTAVDVGSEAIIRRCLQAACERWDIAFVGEESSQTVPDLIPERVQKPYHWSVDPLDGTLPFVEGSPGYAVSIALVDRSGVPLIGVVYDPVDATLLHAIKGQGAYRDGAPITRAASVSRLLVAFADASFRTQEKYADVLDALNDCARYAGLAGVDVVYGSGAVKNACQVLDYPAACYVKLPKSDAGGGSIWDFAATACIVGEAGGWAGNIHGQALALNPGGSTFMNHQGVVYASSEGIARYLIDRFRAAYLAQSITS